MRMIWDIRFNLDQAEILSVLWFLPNTRPTTLLPVYCAVLFQVMKKPQTYGGVEVGKRW